jgi:predicted RNA-binding protein YlqC (UPF0109 family)
MENTIDLQFVEYIVKSLVGNPDAVKIERTIDEKGVLLELTVDPEDLGRVIGKRGATAQSLRTLLRALGTKNDARYNLKIVDNGEPRPEREARQQEDRQTQREDGAAVSAAEDDAWGSATASVAPVTSDDDDDHADAISKARKDLADLDDLDI